jgi:hypothetical protein
VKPTIIHPNAATDLKDLERPGIGSTWRHEKTELEYMVLGVTSEPDAGHEAKFPVTVYYMSQDDGRTWTRTLLSWHLSMTFVRPATPFVQGMLNGET